MTPSDPLPPPRRVLPRAWAVVARPDVAGTVVGLAIGLWMTAGAWGSRPPAGDDVMALLIRAEFGLDELLGRGRTDGWSPRFITGYEHFLFYGPGFTWLVGAVRAGALGFLSLTGALKVVAIGGLVAAAPAAAFLARSFELSRRAAGVAAVLALAVNSPFGVGLAGTFTIALLPHQVAVAGFCIALGCALRTVTDPRRRWVVLLGVSLAAVIVTHVISTLVLGLFAAFVLPTILATHRPRLLAVAARLSAGVLLALGLSAFWLVPYLAHFEDRGVVPAWATPPVGARIADIFGGRILFGPWVMWAVTAGLVYGVVRVLMLRRWALGLLVVPALFLVVGHTLASRYPSLEVSPQLANRGLGYAGLVAVLPLAALLADAARLVPQRVAGTAAALAAAAALVVVPGSPQAGAAQMPEASPVLHEAARVLGAVVPDGARFATERDFPAEIARTGVSHPDFWLAWRAGRDTLNVFGLELSPSPAAAAEPERIGNVPPEQSADGLARLGVTHVATVDPETKPVLARSGRFLMIWERDFMAVFEVVPALGQPAPASLVSVPAGTAATAELVAPGPERYEVDVTTTEPVVATVAVGWSPKWRATVDGRSVTLGRTGDGLLRVPLPRGTHRVELSFEQDGWNRAGAAVSALSLLTLAGALIGIGARRRWRARRDRPPDRMRDEERGRRRA